MVSEGSCCSWVGLGLGLGLGLGFGFGLGLGLGLGWELGLGLPAEGVVAAAPHTQVEAEGEADGAEDGGERSLAGGPAHLVGGGDRVLVVGEGEDIDGQRAQAGHELGDRRHLEGQG